MNAADHRRFLLDTASSLIAEAKQLLDDNGEVDLPASVAFKFFCDIASTRDRLVSTIECLGLQVPGYILRPAGSDRHYPAQDLSEQPEHLPAFETREAAARQLLAQALELAERYQSVST